MSFKGRVEGFKSGLVIGSHVRNTDFWAIAFGRPSAFLLLILCGDIKWVTPNRLTHMSNLLMLAGILVLFDQSYESMVWSAILLNVSITFDSADGQLARYRGCGTELGSYYDKIADYLGHIPVFGMLGWLAVEQTGESYYMLLALVALSGLLTTGYAKWVVEAAALRHGVVLTEPAPASPPKMSAGTYIGKTFLALFRFAEPDLYFWIAIGLICNELEILLWALMISQVIVGVGASVYRGVQADKIDKELQKRARADS
tara:strand:+ start:42918 stop:43691 length:774 start_codon:yes stop_codon:yes gene_type:complete